MRDRGEIEGILCNYGKRSPTWINAELLLDIRDLLLKDVNALNSVGGKKDA